MIPANSQAHFNFRLFALVAGILSYVEGRQIIQSNNITATTLVGTVSLAAFYALFLFATDSERAHKHYLAIPICLQSFLRYKLANPDEPLDFNHPDVIMYLGLSLLTLTGIGMFYLQRAAVDR